ncbi:serine protease [Microcoleus sp. CAWBG58]|uniref:S1 family peptidase n=1 Tax=Microcoleus sp. CAWBG58 TaxID=2841651 RepID=UPI0025E95627|nr:serine protease [Microcoleus sp. CAWBG58]
MVVSCAGDSVTKTPNPPTSTNPISPSVLPSKIPKKTISPPDREQEIKELAEETTVFISGSGSSPGSGVIFAKSGDTYYVLTAAHVVGTLLGESEDPYELETQTDDKKHRIAGAHDYNDRIKTIDKKIDLAVVEFKAEPGQSYRTAPLANSIDPDLEVYAFGLNLCQASGKPAKIPQFTRGKICELRSDPKDGYDVRYTNNIFQGVSGGPIFNSQGQVVAIQAELAYEIGKKYDPNTCETIPKDPNENYSDGWGVPVVTNFDKIREKLPPNTEINLQKSPKKGTIISKNNCPSKPKHCPPILPSGQRPEPNCEKSKIRQE